MADLSDMSDDTVVLDPAPPSSPVRRRAIWGALAVVALAAGTVAVTSFGGDDDAPSALPIALGADGVERSESATMSADMAFGGRITYVAGEDLPALGGDGPAYRLADSVDEDAVQPLADALGLDGELIEEDGTWRLQTDAGTVEVYPGGGASWWYSSASTMSSIENSFGEGSAGSAGSDCVEPENDETKARCAETGMVPTTNAPVTTVPNCAPDVVECRDIGGGPEPIQPPADLPSEDEATSIALALLDRAGVDVRDAKVTVDGPYDSWYVSVEPRIDGQLVTGLTASATIGSQGEVLYASGYLAEPELLGDYATIDTRGAIDRLNEQGFGAVTTDLPVDDMIEPLPAEGGITTTIAIDPGTTTGSADACKEIASDGGVTEVCTGSTGCASAAGGVVSDVDTGSTTVGGEDGSEPPVTTTISAPPEAILTDPYCGEVEPYVPPEPVEIVLHEAEQILMSVPAFDGSYDLYLVPGYRLHGDDDVFVDGVAIDDGELAPVDMDCARPVAATLPCPPGVVRPQIDVPAPEPATDPVSDPAAPPSTGVGEQ